MLRWNVVAQGLLLGLFACPTSGQTSDRGQSLRQPIAPLPAPSASSVSMQVGPVNIPQGLMVSGRTQVPPVGYSFTGMSYEARGGEAWTARASMPTARRNHVAVSVGGMIYAIGGYPQVGGGWLQTNEKYDPATDTWVARQIMPTARAVMAAAVANGKIYVIGGDNGASLGTNEEYDPVLNSWTVKASMPTVRGFLAAASVDGIVYAIGGAGPSGSALTTVEAFNGSTWSTKTPMPTGRRGLSAVAVNGRIYAMGGIDATNSILYDKVEEYDPRTNTWATRQPMPLINFLMGAAVVHSKIYVFGGSNNAQPFAEYDPLSDHWTLKALMPLGQNLAAAATDEVSGKIHVIGGDPGFAMNQEFDPGYRTLYLHQKD